MTSALWITGEAPLDVAVKAADSVEKLLADRARTTIALPTGTTPIHLYRELISRQQTLSSPVDWTRVVTFMLDEYVGLSSAHPNSFQSFLKVHFLDLLPEGPEASHFIACDHHTDSSQAADAYERTIQDHDGLDLVLLGIGGNGHIAFNEPGAPRSSRVRSVALTPQTRRANEVSFVDPNEMPHRAITLGIANIMDARQIILIATGPQKREALDRAFFGKIEAAVPASYLQEHPNLTIIADRDAAPLQVRT